MGWNGIRFILKKGLNHKKRIINEINDGTYLKFYDIKDGIRFIFKENTDRDLWDNNKTYELILTFEEDVIIYKKILTDNRIEFKEIKEFFIKDYKKMEVIRTSWSR